MKLKNKKYKRIEIQNKENFIFIDNDINFELKNSTIYKYRIKCLNSSGVESDYLEDTIETLPDKDDSQCNQNSIYDFDSHGIVFFHEYTNTNTNSVEYKTYGLQTQEKILTEVTNTINGECETNIRKSRYDVY